MRIIKSFSFALLGILLIIIAIYLLGPRTHFEKFDNLPLNTRYDIDQVEAIIGERNANFNIKKDNGEMVIWADGPIKTEYSIVYIHGFSASHEEGAPIHKNIAQKIGANLFLTRLPQHGLTDSLAFMALTPKQMVDYAKEAIKIGKSIGDKVIIMSCSTGGTLSNYLTAGDPDIAAQIMFSPNFQMQDNATKLLTKPWGLQLARKIKGSNYNHGNTPQEARAYWYNKYRLEGVVALQSLIDNTVSEPVFKAIEQPVFVGYYYKNEQIKDFTISVDKIREFEQTISVDPDKKVFKAYPDGRAHVFMSPFFNPNWLIVQTDVLQFLEQVMHIKAMDKVPSKTLQEVLI